MKKSSLLLVALLSLLTSVSAAQELLPGEVQAMRAAAMEKPWLSAVPAALGPRGTWPWQPVAPKTFRRSLRTPPPMEYKFEPRIVARERGAVERFRVATEQLALGLSADPPRVEYPLLVAGPRSAAPSKGPYDVVQLSPLGKSSEAKISLTNDPATIGTKPYTLGIVKASRGPAPPRTDIGVPDPFVIEREARLRVVPADLDPPAPSFVTPARPLLPVAEPKK